MRVAIGCDHKGLSVKLSAMKFVVAAGHSYQDFGCYTTEAVDYPDIARDVAEAVAGNQCDRGILICDTGIGMSIAANKIRGIRAALCHDGFTAGRSRQHNDANVLCLAARKGEGQIAEVLSAFLNTDFEGGRHAFRIDKIRELEKLP